MRCKRVKELLLTDYIDDEVGISLKEEFDKHIEDCQACMTYKINIDKGLSPLFEQAKAESPQDEMWQNIRPRIIQGNQKSTSKIFALNFFLRKGVFAFATVAALLFIIISFHIANNNQLAATNKFLLEEGSFLYSLSSSNGQESFNNADFGTIIEEYIF